MNFPLPAPAPGLSVDDQGSGVYSICAPRAERIELCTFHDGTERRFPLHYTSGGIHRGEVEGIVEGIQYGLRAYGPWDPGAGYWFNPDHVLLDPYALGVVRAQELTPAMFTHTVDAQFYPQTQIERAVHGCAEGPRSVHVPTPDPVNDATRPRHSWAKTVIYEAHVRGFSALNPQIPEDLRGTYAGLAHPASLEYLKDLGITALQLLPIHASIDEPHVARLGLRNYWGYNTLSFYAPHPGYATQAARNAGPSAVVREVRAMIDALHSADIEVIVDVVYNHTSEGDHHGPITSLSGIDGQEYYLRSGGRLVDVTGTGNALDTKSPAVRELIMGSLRMWVQRMGVDGFRFDLATTLARGEHGFDPSHPLLSQIASDPALAGAKLIVEPWDIGPGGWQTGNFPARFSEWNDSFRDHVRSFWLSAARDQAEGTRAEHSRVRDMATRLSGSEDIFRRHDPHDLPRGRSLRSSHASINFVTAHDGMTLHDLTAYNHKHNEANGESGRDGTDNNRSFNHGVEGPAPSTRTGHRLADRRDRTARNVMASLLVSAGVPMLTAGDEFLRTQAGNNNAFCQDNEVSYLAWSGEHSRASERGSRQWEFTRHALDVRSRIPALTSGRFLTEATSGLSAQGSVAWFGVDGVVMEHREWFDPHLDYLLALLPHGPRIMMIALINAERETRVRLPDESWWSADASIVLDSSLGRAHVDSRARHLDLCGPSIVVVQAHAPVGHHEVDGS